MWRGDNIRAAANGLQIFRENSPREAHSLQRNKSDVLLSYKMNGHELMIINIKHSINNTTVACTYRQEGGSTSTRQNEEDHQSIP